MVAATFSASIANGADAVPVAAGNLICSGERLDVTVSPASGRSLNEPGTSRGSPREDVAMVGVGSSAANAVSSVPLREITTVRLARIDKPEERSLVSLLPGKCFILPSDCFANAWPRTESARQAVSLFLASNVKGAGVITGAGVIGRLSIARETACQAGANLYRYRPESGRAD